MISSPALTEVATAADNGRDPDGAIVSRSGIGGSRMPLDDQTRRELRRLARSSTAPHRLVVRSRIVLLLDTLGSDRRVAAHLNVTVRTVRRWRVRFSRGGVPVLLRDAPGRGRKPRRAPEVDARILDYLRRKQRGHAVPTLRGLAASLGISLGAAHRLATQLRGDARNS
jgi:transposase